MTAKSWENQPQLFGHPVGLFVLFFAEMWERFSYYGMRAILIFYMTTSLAEDNPGLGWDSTYALALYGWYTMLVYVASIPGGILADKFIGQKNSVFIGGMILVAGHGVLAIDAVWAFFLGLGLIILGVGALKPNISTMVGGLYRHGDERRDQGFTIFYIGINVGAFLSSLIVGALGETVGWHYGFGLAGIGMLAGQIVFMWGRKYLKGIGEPPDKRKISTTAATGSEGASMGQLFQSLLRSPLHLIASGIIMAVGIGLSVSFVEGWQMIAYSLLSIFLSITAGLMMMIYRDINRIEQDRFIVLMLSFLIVIVFWGAFEQAGGLMNIYTLDKIDREVSLLGLDILFIGATLLLGFQGFRSLRKKLDSAYIYFPIAAVVFGVYLAFRFFEFTDPYTIPASVFQAVNALFIIMFGTAVGGFWIWWRKSGKESSSLLKMAIGTIIMGAGFLFMAKASLDIQQYGDKAALYLLIFAYLLHTIGELCASPVALSFITKLAPVKYVSIMMGVYFAATGLGNKVAGGIGESSQAEPINITLTQEIRQPQDLSPYINLDEGVIPEADSTLIKGKAFKVIGNIKIEGEEIRLYQDGTDLRELIQISDKNLQILKKEIQDFEDETGEPLTVVLAFDNDNQPDLEKGEQTDFSDYAGKVEIFEIQDARELRTFAGIFIFTTAFGLLLLVFLKRLKRLTHDAEQIEDPDPLDNKGPALEQLGERS
jgi:POT family proton-dependent oligopeptide transporter